MTELVEREREIETIEQVLDRPGRALMIEGPAGIGKTSLLGVACERAVDRGFDLARARGTELEQPIAFGVARQLFERRVASASAEKRDTMLAGTAGLVPAVLLGTALERLAPDSLFAALHGLYWLVANLATCQPLLLVVDDVQCSDEPSRRWLAYLAPASKDWPSP